MIGNKIILSYNVDHQQLKRLDSNVLVEHSKDYVYIKFIFSDDWRNLDRFVIFNYVDIDNPGKYQLGKDNIIKVPYNFIIFPGFLITLQGVKNDTLITTEVAMINVEISDEGIGHTFVDHVESSDKSIYVKQIGPNVDIKLILETEYNELSNVLSIYSLTYEEDASGELVETKKLLSSINLSNDYTFERVDNQFIEGMVSEVDEEIFGNESEG